jgi:hypothetical protein
MPTLYEAFDVHVKRSLATAASKVVPDRDSQGVTRLSGHSAIAIES